MSLPAPHARTTGHRASFWLAAALTVLPWLQALPLDFDRTAALGVLLPAWWTGRGELHAAFRSLGAQPVWWRTIAVIGAMAVILSTARSAHAAASIVTAANWLLLAMTAIIAGQLVRRDSTAAPRLMTGLALGAALGAATVWLLWVAGDRGAVPLYAHHRIYGLHMIVGAIATTALAIRTTGRSRIAWLAVGTVTWGAVLWSGGRAPLLALGAGLGGWFILRAADRKPLFRVSLLQLLGGLALSLAFWSPRAELGWWHAFARTAAAAQAGKGMSINVSQLTSTRSDFWRESARRASEAPWLGHGPDAYRFLTPKLDGQQPHNVVLQLWLDLGILGAVPMLLLLGGAGWLGGKIARRADHAGGQIAPWIALLAALTLAGLLDGVFYHLLTLLPATLGIGIAMHAAAAEPPAESTRGGWVAWATHAGMAAALVVLAWHAWLFHILVGVAPPAGPQSVAARAVRFFPTTTYGLWNWLDAWHRSDPDTALEWARWAQSQAPNPSMFHIRAAQYLQLRGEPSAALAEMNLAEAKSHWLARPSIAEMKTKMFPTP